MNDNDLISRSAAIEAAIDGADYWDGGCNPERERCIREHMANVPAVDAVPVVHGRWEERMYEWNGIKCILYFCSVCEEAHNYGKAKYCPGCGAKMDGRDEDG